MSIQSYLDSTFSSYDDLKVKVDAESIRLKAEESDLSNKLELERQANQKSARDAVKELKIYFEKLKVSPENAPALLTGSGDHGDEIPELIRSQSLPIGIFQQFNAVKELVHARHVISKLREFEQLSRSLQKQIISLEGYEEGNNDKNENQILDLYHQLATMADELIKLELDDHHHYISETTTTTTTVDSNSRGKRTTSSYSLSAATNGASGNKPSKRPPVTATLIKKSLDHVNSTVLKKIRHIFQNKLMIFLEKNNWPAADTFRASNPSSCIEFQKLFVNVLKVEQEEGIVATKSSSPIPSSPPTPLLSFSILARAEDVRFKFHFEGDRPTNRLDKPEWMFNLVVNTIDSHVEFLTNIVQPALSSVSGFKYRSAIHEFIVSLFPSVYRKLRSMMSELLQEPYILSHLIHEIIAFDTLLRDKFYFTPFDTENWRGVTGDILASNSEWFDVWLSSEKDIALSRYKEILEMPNSWEIDWEAVDNTDTKPTVCAINIKDLLEGITEHYSLLRSVNYRLRFLLDIQINILDKYYDRLSESISAFESMTSSLARAVGGVSTEDSKLVLGVNGLERLCRIYGSLFYIINSLETWGDDLFFLDLWDDISKLSGRDRKTAAANTGPAKIPENEDDEGTLFDETISSYKKLKQKVFIAINNHLRKELQTSMKEYFRYGNWIPEVSPNSSDANSISPKLVQPIKTMSKLLNFLRRFHSTNDYERASRGFVNDLEKYIWNYIIQANKFNQEGGKRLTRDITGMWSVWVLPRDSSFSKLEQACLLLCSPVDHIEMDEHSISELQEKLSLTDLNTEDIRGILRRRQD